MYSRVLDYIISDQNEFYNQQFYYYTISPNKIIFYYSPNVLQYMNIIVHNVFQYHTLSEIVIENASDNVVSYLINFYDEFQYITLKEIKHILNSQKSEICMIHSSHQEKWDKISYTKYILCK